MLYFLQIAVFLWACRTKGKDIFDNVSIVQSSNERDKNETPILFNIEGVCLRQILMNSLNWFVLVPQQLPSLYTYAHTREDVITSSMILMSVWMQINALSSSHVTSQYINVLHSQGNLWMWWYLLKIANYW